jgi:hypothetical protein
VHGALHAVNDRIKIMKGPAQVGGEVQVARQVILNCGKAHGLGNGCHGGDGFDVFEYMHRFGLPSESCQNYVAHESPECNDYYICQNCMPVGEPAVNKCWAVKNFTRYRVKEYGRLPSKDEKAIMSEIYARGPVTCGFATNDDFDYEYYGGVYIDKRNSTEMDHDVEVVGWGETDTGVKYWMARNSWGTYWGENGFFKILRGVNHARFEEECTFAIPDISEEEPTQNGKLVGGMYGLREKPLRARAEDGNPEIYTSAASVRSQQDSSKKTAASSSPAISAKSSKTTDTQTHEAAATNASPPSKHEHQPAAAESDSTSSTTTKHTAAGTSSDSSSADLESHVGLSVGVVIGCAAVLGLAVILYRAIRSPTTGYETI